ncbi:hypothetical protein [Shewanella surugensis]|uniref:Uncharacterized protein n=1 Tax=Shewanella surugensis TaxID=212020 RepID=A0ABT0LHR6_9GAMM|nr:hypothetical protein [Shewanella surugensis]MCL1127262.1 hypothetical protein [Shewanella surugensis]
MRIRCSFIVEPELHTHHQYAIDILRAWQKQEKELESSKEVAMQRSNAFHQSLYLSGLYLHKLSPDLPKLVSDLLPNDELSVEPLLWQLAQVGIKQQQQGAALSSAQWLQLTSILENHHQTQTQALKAELDSTPLAIKEAAEPNVQAQLKSIEQHQLQLLTHLDGLKLNSDTSQSEGSQSASIENDALRQQLQSIQVGQQDVMRRLELMSQQFQHVQMVTSADKTDKDSLDTQLKRARSVKAKGLW